jgi:hypothetical protein
MLLALSFCDCLSAQSAFSVKSEQALRSCDRQAESGAEQISLGKEPPVDLPSWQLRIENYQRSNVGAEAFQQFDNGLEVIAATMQGQIVYFAGGYSRIISSMASTLRMRHLPRCSSGGLEGSGISRGGVFRTSRTCGEPK